MSEAYVPVIEHLLPDVEEEVKAPTRDQIIELYQSEDGLGLRYQEVASRLGTDPIGTLRVLHELEDKGILYRQDNEYYQLNLPHLWKE